MYSRTNIYKVCYCSRGKGKNYFDVDLIQFIFRHEITLFHIPIRNRNRPIKKFMVKIPLRPTANYMPPEQLAQVLDAIPTLKIRKWPDQDIQMLFKICYWSALRIGEAIRLKAEDFDLELCKIYLGDTKTNTNDEASIPRFFTTELALFLKDKNGSLFPGLSYDTCIKWIKRLGKQLQIKAWITPQSETHEKTKTHIFRKSLAKDQMYGTFGKKAPLSTISKTLRHKGKNPLASTVHYLKADSEDVSNYWDDVGSVLG